MRIISEETITGFRNYLEQEEKSIHTIQKYIRDIRTFRCFAGNAPVTKDLVIQYKQVLLQKQYAVRSINSMLASLNSIFQYMGWRDCQVRSIKIQQRVYCEKERELTRTEYMRLVRAAEKRGKKRLSMILQTICSTGIRISELSFITVEAAKTGEVMVSSKGKMRAVFLVKALRKKLLGYAKEKKIRSGRIFITRNGNPMNRTNIWREMKNLCRQAGVDEKKVYPHNLRHLFAKIFYNMEKDIAKLADVLGHSSINTTRIYIITSGNEHRRQMELMHLIL